MKRFVKRLAGWFRDLFRSADLAPRPSPGDVLSTGDVWRGIGPQKPSGRKPPYKYGPEGAVIFAHDAFSDKRVQSTMDPQLYKIEPSVLIPIIAGPPRNARDCLRAAKQDTEALAGLHVAGILTAKVVTSASSYPGPTTEAVPTPLMTVVFEPVNEDGIVIPAHAVIKARPEWHPGPVLVDIRRALAILATQYHAENGWVLDPAAA